MIIDLHKAKHYFDRFQANDEETVKQRVDNAHAWEWMKDGMPRFECPDAEIEETFYFRWWIYRKHLKQTPRGCVVTEFHPDVGWAGLYNTINGSAGHHFYEGRWLANQTSFLDDYARFWLRGGGDLRSYSAWLADSIWQAARVSGDFSTAVDLLPDLVSNFRAWEDEHLHPSGLFWSIDDRDAMEFSISGNGLRPTLNSYLYADALAIAGIARQAGNAEIAETFTARAERIKALVQERLWDERDSFFKTVPLESKDSPVETWDFRKMDPDHNVREQIGFIPWAFGLPDAEYSAAWAQLMDPRGFYAPYGPTTAEQRHPNFRFKHDEHECLWNGPSWPFATCQTLTGLANLLHTSDPKTVSRVDYLHLLKIYAHSHYRILPDGRRVNWIDENLDPFTGVWLARSILEEWSWPAVKGGRERGKDYNHSTFCDLVISGLVGVRPDETGRVTVNPLASDREWLYFCLDNLSVRGKKVTVLFDATGERYGQGKGLRVFVDGKCAAARETLGELAFQM
jgi:hypothetical protein